ncbi:ACP S-malonyltransferase [Facilibium subflavum]|uniref:ACP S-malonyltransferase n=1 Tax=Facilibium subflavum TaxID=2219058 RepID=UPI000E659A2D|nr:ACP S-malonyltransferase [Facilibium subflavum]
MSKTAIVFPGQGSQKLGMLGDYYAQFDCVRSTFQQANDTLGFDLWDIIQNNEDKLNQTEFTQPALLAASIAIWHVFQQTEAPKASLLAGHSLGEYSALVCANALDFEDALKLVHLRGQLMQSAVTDKACAMSAILALSNEDVIECCKAAQDVGIVEAANFNAHGQVVISGQKEAVEKACALAKEKGAKRAQLLPVSVPSHCSLMKEAAQKFAQALDKIPFKTPKIQVLHNFDVKSHKDPQKIKEALTKQLYSPVLWTQTIEKMAEKGIETVIECGAGKVLTTMNKRITKAMNYFDSADVSALEKLKSQQIA